MSILKSTAFQGRSLPPRWNNSDVREEGEREEKLELGKSKQRIG